MRVVVLLLAAVSAGCVTANPIAPEYAGDSPQAQAYAHYMMAVIHERNGQFDEALAEKLKAAELMPEATSLAAELAQTYLRLHDFENALKMCRRLVDADPDDPTRWLVLGLVYKELERYDEATAAYDKAIALDPGNVQGYIQLVQTAVETNDFVTAVDWCNKLIEIRPNSSALYVQLGMNLARINDLEAARDALERALRIDGAAPRARDLLGVVYLELGENANAQEQFRALLASDPTNAQAALYLAAATARLGRYAEALALLDKVEEKDAPYLLKRAYLQLRAGRCSEAAGQTPPEEGPILGTLFRVLARKALGESLDPFLASLDTIEGDLDLEWDSYLAELLRLFGKKDVGQYLKDQFEALRAQGVRSRTVDLLLARTLMVLECYEEAEPILVTALDSYGPDKRIHYHLATVYEEMDHFEDAVKHLKAYLAMDPHDADTLNFLGYLYAENDVHLDEAEELLHKALKADPKNGFYLDSLGWVYYRKGKADEAIRLIRQAILAMESDDAVLRDHLGDAYLLKGDVQKALAEWRRARRLDPKLEGVQEKIDRYQTSPGSAKPEP